jgi:hypothetical protein
MTDTDDDELTLSSAAQAALAEFLTEKQLKEQLQTEASHDEAVDIEAFPEDWQV